MAKYRAQTGLNRAYIRAFLNRFFLFFVINFINEYDNEITKKNEYDNENVKNENLFLRFLTRKRITKGRNFVLDCWNNEYENEITRIREL